jgi:hypothetical protein
LRLGETNRGLSRLRLSLPDLPPHLLYRCVQVYRNRLNFQPGFQSNASIGASSHPVVFPGSRLSTNLDPVRMRLGKVRGEAAPLVPGLCENDERGDLKFLLFEPGELYLDITATPWSEKPGNPEFFMETLKQFQLFQRMRARLPGDRLSPRDGRGKTGRGAGQPGRLEIMPARREDLGGCLPPQECWRPGPIMAGFFCPKP